MTRRAWVLFAAMSVIWGVPYLLIRVAIRDFTPGTLVFARTAIGGLILLPFALRGGLRAAFGPVLRRWPWLLAFAAVEIAVPWLLLSDAEKVLSSSLSGLLVAAVPLVGIVVAKVAGTDGGGGGWVRYTGLLLGLGGVVVLLGLDFGDVHAWPLVELLLVAIGYSVGPVLMVRHLAGLPSIPVISASLLLTAVGYLPYGITHWPSGVGAKSGWSVIGLGVVCTALAFIVFFALVAAIGPARATVFTYVNPAVAVLLGVVLLGEDFTVGMAVGFPLILIGSVLAARAGQSMRTSPLGVSNTAATSPVSPSNGESHSTSTPSRG